TPDTIRAMAVGAAITFSAGLALDAWHLTRLGVVSASGEQLGRDFVNYWAGAKLAILGKASSAYNFQEFLNFEREFTAPNAAPHWYGYPPVAMLLALQLG